MIAIKKSHDDIVDIVDIDKNDNIDNANFPYVHSVRIVSGHPKSLVISYILFIYSLIIILGIMAHCTTSDGINTITGALKKTTEQGVNHITVVRQKHFHDPLTSEETDTGPKELYIKKKRDYNKHPLTPGEQAQRSLWQQACNDAPAIYNDPSHPRYMELYHRWRAQLSEPHHYKQFPPFVRAVLEKESHTLTLPHG